MPALDAFAPELIFISAGFDAHARDPQPADGDAGVPIGAQLTWRAGREGFRRIE